MSSAVTVHYAFHALHGLKLAVLTRARGDGGLVTVVDPAGSAIRIPAWMLRPAEADATIVLRPTIAASALLTVRELVATLRAPGTPAEGGPDGAAQPHSHDSEEPDRRRPAAPRAGDAHGGRPAGRRQRGANATSAARAGRDGGSP